MNIDRATGTGLQFQIVAIEKGRTYNNRIKWVCPMCVPANGSWSFEQFIRIILKGGGQKACKEYNERV